MTLALRPERSTMLPTASAPVAAAWWNGSLLVAASDLEAQAARLWFVNDGQLAGAEPLPLEYVAGLVATTDGVVITGSTPRERRVAVGYVDGSVTEPIELPCRDDVARDPHPLVTSAGVLIAWEEYDDDRLVLVAQRVERDRHGWRLDGKEVRGAKRPFAPAADTAALADGLVAVRVEESGAAAVERLDRDLRPRTSAALSGGLSRVAVAARDRVVVAAAGRAGEPVVLRTFDLALAEIAGPVTLPVRDQRASVDAIRVAIAPDAPLALVVQVETVLDDPETVDRGDGPELGPAPRQTTETCTAVELETGALSGSYVLKPPSYGTAAVAWHLDRIHLVHGSSPLHITELVLTR